METRYDPKTVEQRWYDVWEQRGYFTSRESLTGKTFTISMPPPNITGDLHMGHAMYTLQDVLIRWHRMLGDAALWVPGTDHAAIATQNVLEKQLAKKGTTKEKIGREAWDRLVQAWYDTTGTTILRQMRRLGFSADWSRIRFTMDPTYIEAIRYVFVQLWRAGLIYRGRRGGRPGIRDRRHQGNARARRHRLRNRRAPPPRGAQHPAPRRPDEYPRGAGARRAVSAEGTQPHRRVAAGRGRLAEDRALSPFGRTLRPLRCGDRAAGLGPVVGQD